MTNTWLTEMKPSAENSRRANDASRWIDMSIARHGAGLTAIGQVLRHQDLGTTALYAKVDFTALRAVAQPRPGGAA
jgi:hypothetical protein